MLIKVVNLTVGVMTAAAIGAMALAMSMAALILAQHLFVLGGVTVYRLMHL